MTRRTSVLGANPELTEGLLCVTAVAGRKPMKEGVCRGMVTALPLTVMAFWPGVLATQMGSASHSQPGNARRSQNLFSAQCSVRSCCVQNADFSGIWLRYNPAVPPTEMGRGDISICWPRGRQKLGPLQSRSSFGRPRRHRAGRAGNAGQLYPLSPGR